MAKGQADASLVQANAVVPNNMNILFYSNFLLAASCFPYRCRQILKKLQFIVSKSMVQSFPWVVHIQLIKNFLLLRNLDFNYVLTEAPPVGPCHVPVPFIICSFPCF